MEEHSGQSSSEPAPNHEPAELSLEDALSPQPAVESAAPGSEDESEALKHYIDSDVLFKHIARQSRILKDSLADRFEVPTDALELSLAYERSLFSPSTPPKKQENGTCEPNPRINFYPTFMLPETLATYHIFFFNHKIPLSCRANRSRADEKLMLTEGDCIPDFPTTDRVPKIFEGLGSEETVASNSLEEKRDSALVELLNDSPRLAIIKRSTALTHFAYPAINMPPKVMSCVMEEMIVKKAEPVGEESTPDGPEGGAPVVSDAELAKWLGSSDATLLEDRRKLMMAVVLVTAQLECMKRFFTSSDMIRKLGETLHYTFRHGYVKQACKISNVELPNLVSYMGILHENRLGQHVLHNTLRDEQRRDYIRDTIFLMLLYTWQTAMGVWQQCLEVENIKELSKLLRRKRRALWTGFDERTTAGDLADIIFPSKLLSTLQAGLPDFTSQSMMQNFRSFILERSGILPALCNAIPSDFVPIEYKECPPPLWAYCYLLKLANYLMFHSDVAFNMEGEGLFECYCRCNLCTPHRCLATNTALLNEVQAIGSFELQRPPNPDGSMPPTLKLTAGAWTSAYLRKFEPADYRHDQIRFYEDQSKPPKSEPSACIITQAAILAQLHDIKKEREKFLLKKGHGVYLDPKTGEELNTLEPSVSHNAASRQTDQSKFDKTEVAEKSRARTPSSNARRGNSGEHSRRGRRGGMGRYRQFGRGGERDGGRGIGGWRDISLGAIKEGSASAAPAENKEGPKTA
ncbi:100K [Bovine mastadenovirus A]|uniref:100K n=1 Tax=Bovine mastadenovirus A TaxID=129953 RepID=UPI0000443F95|nr:100K [Bovine mastadenovirus A]